MPFPLDSLRDAVAAVFVLGGWTRAHLADTPEASAQAHHSFAFGLPTKGKATAWNSSGRLAVWSWPVRFVWHLDPSDDGSQTEGTQAAAEAVDAVNYRSNWQADVETLGVELLATGLLNADDHRVLVITYLVKAQVYEARPAF